MTRVAVVIPSWNTRELLSRCLESLERSDAELEIVVVDNASADGSAEEAARHPNVRLLRNAHNAGFAAASNQGIQATRAPYVLLLNSDTEVARDAIDTLAGFLDRNEAYAACAPRLAHPDGTTQRACMNFPRWRTPLWFGTPLERWFPHSAELQRYFARDFDHERDADVEQPPAAALLLRRSALEQVGLLDESMVLFFNDVDLSKRLAAAGWRTRFLHAAKVLHVGGASTRQFAARVERWHLDRLRYFRKHHGRIAGVWVKAATALAWLDFVLRAGPSRSAHTPAPADSKWAVTRALLRFLRS